MNEHQPADQQTSSWGGAGQGEEGMGGPSVHRPSPSAHPSVMDYVVGILNIISFFSSRTQFKQERKNEDVRRQL